ncbi:MAG: cation:proton antiporter [Rikenellaceae bacterium]
MKKVLSFSILLLLGLVLSQTLPTIFGEDYDTAKNHILTPLLSICLSFIMINVGREFELDKSRWRDYTADYFIAVATAALPWILIALYFIFVLLPSTMWGEGQVWRESLLLSRFAAPTSAGILFAMLATLNLSKSWIYQKIQVLAIFDDLDTILLMIPLQMLMIGMKWQMGAMVAIVVLLLWFGWKKLESYDIPQGWGAILSYSVAVVVITQIIYAVTYIYFGHENSIHIEVLLPAFVLGMVIKHQHHESKISKRVTSSISLLFMFLVGLSVPFIIGGEFEHGGEAMISHVPMMPWHEIGFHVLMVSIISNLGKLVPVFFYRDRKLSERLAVSVGMFTRGEVGAGVIFIAIGYNLGSNALIIAALTLVLNLILTGGFVVWVKQLAMKTYTPEEEVE